jgi:hypothetical protein
MVMPYLCELDRPPFSFIDEALDFIEQTLEVSQAVLCLLSAITTPNANDGFIGIALPAP